MFVCLVAMSAACVGATIFDVCATVDVVDEAFIDEFKSELYAHALESRTEPGVLRFDIFENADNKAEFTLREQYASQAAYDVHKETDAFKQFVAWITSGAIDVTEGCPQQSKVTSDDAVLDVCALVEVVDEAFIDEFKSELYAHALASRTEPGVLRFDVFENA